MRCFIFALFLLLLTGCMGKSVYIEEASELLPKDVALEYLVSEDVIKHTYYNSFCAFSHTGIHTITGFEKFENFEFYSQRFALDLPGFWKIYAKSTDGEKACIPYWGKNDQGQLSKVATALSSLGMKQRNKKALE